MFEWIFENWLLIVAFIVESLIAFFILGWHFDLVRKGKRKFRHNIVLVIFIFSMIVFNNAVYRCDWDILSQMKNSLSHVITIG